MTVKELNEKLKKDDIEIEVIEDMPEHYLNMELKSLLCKHVFSLTEKAYALLNASIMIGYDYCLWNVANNKPQDFNYDMNRILKMEKENYNHALRIIACKYEFSDEKYYWCDNIHSAIKYIRQYGDNVELKDLPFYVVDCEENKKTTVYSYNKSVRLIEKDIIGIVKAADKRYRWSRYKKLVDVSYTIKNFIDDNPDFISYGIPVYDGFIKDENMKGKYVFWDVDGVLAPYRFNNHVGDPNGTPNGMSLAEIDNGCFFNRRPSEFMQKVVAGCGSKENIIMGHYQVQKEADDKHKWLDRYYPFITKRIFLHQDTPKYVAMINYCKENDISLDDIIFVDDSTTILREAERHGIESWHISSFLDYEREAKQYGNKQN